MYQCQVQGEVRDQIAGGYLRGTTYLRTPLFGMIPVVTLFVVCAGAVVMAAGAWLVRDWCSEPAVMAAGVHTGA